MDKQNKYTNMKVKDQLIKDDFSIYNGDCMEVLPEFSR